VNRFVIGSDVVKWPIHEANENETELTIFNTDAEDPPCIDIYTPGMFSVLFSNVISPCCFQTSYISG
jgi:hypothetical protein